MGPQLADAARTGWAPAVGPPTPFGPPRRSRLRLVLVVVVAVVAASALGGYLYWLSLQPHIVLTDAYLIDGRLCEFGVWRYGGMSLFVDLANSGGAGWADVAFYFDGAYQGAYRIYVLHDSTKSGGIDISVQDCLQHSGDATIVDQYAG